MNTATLDSSHANPSPGSACRLGVEISPQTFSERYREAERYVGFKYMAFVMGQWADRDQPGSRVREQMENLVRLAVEGT